MASLCSDDVLSTTSSPEIRTLLAVPIVTVHTLSRFRFKLHTRTSYLYHNCGSSCSTGYNQPLKVGFCPGCRLKSPHCNAWWQGHGHRHSHGHPNAMSDLSTISFPGMKRYVPRPVDSLALAGDAVCVSTAGRRLGSPWHCIMLILTSGWPYFKGRPHMSFL
jgi:hypothetical protein